MKRETPWLIKHGKINTPEYEVWRSMKQRCYYPKKSQYKHYGGRGIKVCDRWKDSFVNFLEDMGERPDGYTLDRIDGDKGYSPDNCRWATRKEQSNNIKSNRYVTYKGESKTISEWADELGMKYYVLYNRIGRYGWSAEKAFNTPVVIKKPSLY